jgi:hypothetical protein
MNAIAFGFTEEANALAKRLMDSRAIAFLKQAIALGVEVFGAIGLAIAFVFGGDRLISRDDDCLCLTLRFSFGDASRSLRTKSPQPSTQIIGTRKIQQCLAQRLKLGQRQRFNLRTTKA